MGMLINVHHLIDSLKKNQIIITPSTQVKIALHSESM